MKEIFVITFKFKMWEGTEPISTPYCYLKKKKPLPVLTPNIKEAFQFPLYSDALDWLNYIDQLGPIHVDKNFYQIQKFYISDRN